MVYRTAHLTYPCQTPEYYLWLNYQNIFRTIFISKFDRWSIKYLHIFIYSTNFILIRIFDMSRPTVHIVIVKHFQDEPSVPMECISPLSMLAFRRFDMAWTVQLRRADRLEVLLFLLGSMAVSCSSSEQSFSRFMNSVKYLKQRKTFTDLLWLHLDTVL